MLHFDSINFVKYVVGALLGFVCTCEIRRKAFGSICNIANFVIQHFMFLHQVQHQSMMAMMGALDEQQPPVAWQPNIPASQTGNDPENYDQENVDRRPKGRRVMNGALEELRNLQNFERSQQKKGRSKSQGGKENVDLVDSSLRMSELRTRENIEMYRVTQDGQNFYANFLRVPAERDNDEVRFPQIPKEAWRSQSNFAPSNRGIPEMPLLHVDRTVPAHKFPVSHRGHSLPQYQPEPGYFHPPSHGPAPQGHTQPLLASAPSSRQAESPDSGIGMPLLRLQYEDNSQRRQPRFGELLPPDMVIESARAAEQKEMLREKYLREYHQLQVMLFLVTPILCCFSEFVTFVFGIQLEFQEQF